MLQLSFEYTNKIDFIWLIVSIFQYPIYCSIFCENSFVLFSKKSNLAKYILYCTINFSIYNEYMLQQCVFRQQFSVGCIKMLLYFCCMLRILYNKPCPMRKMTLVRNTCFYVCSMNTKQKYLVVKGYEIGHSICQGSQ